MTAPVVAAGRERTLAWALAIPAVLVTVALVAVEAWRLAAPARAQAGYRIHGSLGEAIANDDVRGAFDFVRRGQDPNALIPVHDPQLTGGEEVFVPPIVWAAAADRRAIVLMLLGTGATFARGIDRAAPCVADRLGFDEVARTLRRLGPLPPATTCPDLAPGPLLVGVARLATMSKGEGAE
ncbi:MAG: hypothetical protein FJW23_01580 [Acidimicrobiia bacterium]|nr:hypothetical protein [Acidimicrobiia bacterium]